MEYINYVKENFDPNVIIQNEFNQLDELDELDEEFNSDELDESKNNKENSSLFLSSKPYKKEV